MWHMGMSRAVKASAELIESASFQERGCKLRPERSPSEKKT